MIPQQGKPAVKILLFDMDGVLLAAEGYHRALQESVEYVGRALGYQGVQLSQEDIYLFEAVGITSEWDSSAICSALFLLQLWENGMDLRLPVNPFAEIFPPHPLPCPDFGSFCRAFARGPNPDASPLQRAEGMLLSDGGRYTPEQRALIQSILREARAIHNSLTHRIFQELVLGSRIFEKTYNLPPYMSVDSYLSRFDRPALAPEQQSSLHDWLDVRNHFAAIFTNRPSRPPNGFFSTPEAEIGAQTAGLERLPIVGFGALSWYAFTHGMDFQAFLKPSPVHVLAALWLAVQPEMMADSMVEKERRLIHALEVSYHALDAGGRENWIGLEGAQVYVFEDSVRGMKSARAAQELLAKMGIRTQVELCGITDSLPKQETLNQIGAAVFPNLDIALSRLGIT